MDTYGKIFRENEHSEEHCFAFVMMNWTHPSIHNACNTIYLIQKVIQAFIQIFQIKENHSSSCFHADFDLADITADLQKNYTQSR